MIDSAYLKDGAGRCRGKEGDAFRTFFDVVDQRSDDPAEDGDEGPVGRQEVGGDRQKHVLRTPSAESGPLKIRNNEF